MLKRNCRTEAGRRFPAKRDFPAGLERTIVVDLTGKLPAGTRRIRLQSNLEIYWDQVLIDQSSDAEARTSEVPLAQPRCTSAATRNRLRARAPAISTTTTTASA